MDDAYELSSKRVERNVLQAELEEEELWESEEFQRLEQRIGELKAQMESREGYHSETATAHSQSA